MKKKAKQQIGGAAEEEAESAAGYAGVLARKTGKPAFGRGEGQVPPLVYEPENPMDVGLTLGQGIQAPYAHVMYMFALLM